MKRLTLGVPGTRWLKESCTDGYGGGIFALTGSSSTYAGVQGFPSISVKAKMLRRERRSWVPGRLHARGIAVEEVMSSGLASCKGTLDETTNHLRRGNDFHGIFHHRGVEVAGTRKLIRY